VITIPEAKPEKLEIVPTAIPLKILFQDNDLAVIYKGTWDSFYPQICISVTLLYSDPGVAVHRGEGEATEDVFLVNILKHHFQDNLSLKGGDERPGIVHRLDKGASNRVPSLRIKDLRLKQSFTHRYFGSYDYLQD
jgi:23S rRNA pseudouridine1911/1915/1917 synthase